MRYIGGKRLLNDKIFEMVNGKTGQSSSFIDIFAGSGSVSNYIKSKGYKVAANDILYFSYSILRGSVAHNTRPGFKKLSKIGIENPVAYLNSIELNPGKYGICSEELFIYNNYSPNEGCSRMYLRPENALKIDIVRIMINRWRNEGLTAENEYYYLLGSIIAGVPWVSNITGTYGAYLKHWDKRTFNGYKLIEPELFDNNVINCCYNEDANELIKKIGGDILYIDPPYNERQYLPNYHLLETVARYDYPSISGVTGLRGYSSEKSLYCQKSSAARVFDELISNADFKYVIVSYNNEGIMSTEELSEILMRHARPNTFLLQEFDYRRYKNKIPNHISGLKEQLYFIERK